MDSETRERIVATLLLMGFVEKETVSDAAFPIVLRHEAADISIYPNRTWGYVWLHRTNYYPGEWEKLVGALAHDLEIVP